MLFNSYIFIFLFLPAAIIGYYTLNKLKKYVLGEYFLIIMSLIFYAYFNTSYFPIIFFSILGNYYLVYMMNHLKYSNWKKAIFIIGLLSNIGILFYYKYMGFFIQNINVLFKTNFLITKLLLPLGISFFTFQQLSYVIDSYLGRVKTYSFRQYVLFVTFFPQLIAGPIVLHDEIIPQFKNIDKKTFNWNNFSEGLMAFSFGMAKKVIIADSFGNVVNYGFANLAGLDSTNAIFTMLSYTIQIYFDFSGYCDMATGIAKMFNIDLPINFNSPYKALSITEFWKRWHITLTRFLRTYIYFPLGGNRKGQCRTYLNLFIVFLVSGLWHGANYTFIVWGILHGTAMIIERIFKEKQEKLHPALKWLMTIVFINFTWIIFRANTLNDATILIKQIMLFDFGSLSKDLVSALGFNGLMYFFSHIGRIGYYMSNTYPIYAIIGILFIILFCKNTNERINTFKPTLLNCVVSSFLLFYSILSLSGMSTFLYFNF